MPTASQARILMSGSGNSSTWTANIQNRVCTPITCFPIAKLTTTNNVRQSYPSYRSSTWNFSNFHASKNPFIIPAKRQRQPLTRGNDSPNTASFHQELDVNGYDGILSFDRKSKTFRWLISIQNTKDIPPCTPFSSEKFSHEQSEYEMDEREGMPPCPCPSIIRTFRSSFSSDYYDELKVDSHESTIMPTAIKEETNGKVDFVKRSRTAPPRQSTTSKRMMTPGNVKRTRSAISSDSGNYVRTPHCIRALSPSILNHMPINHCHISSELKDEKTSRSHGSVPTAVNTGTDFASVELAEKMYCESRLVTNASDATVQRFEVGPPHEQHCNPQPLPSSHQITHIKKQRPLGLRSKPMTVCFSLNETHSNSICHKNVKKMVEEQTGVKLMSLQYDPIYMRSPDSLTTSRWIATLSCKEDFEFLTGRGLMQDNDYIVIHGYDDTLASEQNNTKLYKEVKWLNNFQRKAQKSNKGRSLYSFETFKEHISNFL